MSILSQSNDSLPYREIPNHPENFSAGGVAARIMDGLGFRFYWATDGLRNEDLIYKPSGDSRSVDETIDHILSMTNMVVFSVCKIKNERNVESTFEEKRAQILNNIKSVSDVLLTSSSEDFENYNIVLRNGDTLPFWYFINGQISDCIWHCGQISSFRRITGNPLNANASMFKGEVRD
ncbi:hypothetical protein [Brumimicrobium mesophilum]|uniref:hypothetical protein n=1 Tax=Brumimicrobium mesophilum TaxID=392717 RepID=UPI000D141A31|nr:hypothetical protein [Brumimicrobium mesophilum]